tara:strand:+ start:624 stop:746 length:123 start_codon:yes stop_codon:yes gene_type:complete
MGCEYEAEMRHMDYIGFDHEDDYCSECGNFGCTCDDERED